MNIQLDDRQQQIIDEVSDFSRTVLAPRAHENEVNGAFPMDLVEQMAERGYLGATMPEELGGLGLDPIAYGLLVAAIEKGDCSASRLLTVHSALSSEAILKCGSEEQVKRWIPSIAKGETLCAFGLTEPEHGTDAAGIQCSYREEDDHFVLNGHKRWISFSGIANLFVIIARDDKLMSAFLVERDTEGVEVNPMSGLMAGRACHISEILLNEVVIPKQNLIGQIGQGFAFVANTALDHGRYSIAWSGVGLAEAALDAMTAYSKKRKQFGEKIGSFQLIREIIAEAVTRLYAAKSLCLRAGQSRIANDPDSVMETTIAKHFTATTAFKTACDAVQVHGGNGFCDDYPVERLMREAKVLEVIEGTSQIQQMVISMHGLRRYGRK